MPSPSKMRFGRSVAIGALITAALALASCREYLDRRETITLEVGDAVQVNHATQTIERWPRASAHDRWLSDGERARIAVDNYRKGTTPTPKADSSEATPTDASPSGQ